MKNIRRNVIFTGIGYVLPLLAALATIPLMTLKLGVDLYGLYVICISLIGFMALVDLGIGQTVVKYVASYEATGQREKVKPMLDVALLIYLCIGVVSVIGLYFAAPWLAQGLYDDSGKQALAQEVLRMTALPLLLSYLNQFFLNVCKAYHRFDLPAIIHNAGNLGGIVLGALLLLLGYSLREVIIGYVFIQLAAFSAGYLACHQVLPDTIRPFPAFDQKIFREIMTFSAYTFVGNFVGSLVSRADKLLIGILVGTEAVTYYQIPFTIAQMANGIIHTLAHITFPRFSEMFSLQDRQGLLRLYRMSNHVVFLLTTVIAVLLITVGGDFLALWISPEFAQKATLPLQIMAVYFFLHSNTVLGYWLLQGAGQAKLTAFMSVVDALAYFAALYWLGSAYGYLGAGIALFFLMLTVPLQYFWIERHVGHGCMEYLTQLLAFLLGGYAMVYLLENLNLWLGHSLLQIVVSSLLALVMLVIALWALLQGKNRAGGIVLEPVCVRD